MRPASLGAGPFLKSLSRDQRGQAFSLFSRKQADRNVFGNFSFDASQFTGRLLDPYKATHFREDRSEARRGFEAWVGLHFEFGKRAVAARLGDDKSE